MGKFKETAELGSKGNDSSVWLLKNAVQKLHSCDCLVTKDVSKISLGLVLDDDNSPA